MNTRAKNSGTALHRPSRLAALFTLLACIFQFSGCDGLDNCDAGQCLTDSDISVSVVSQTVSFPANVQILYRVVATDGELLGSLDSTNFLLRDNGTAASEFESSRSVIGQQGDFITNVLLVLDLSGSITSSENLTTLKSASKTFINTVSSANTEIGIYWFDGEAALKQLVDFTDDADDLNAAIDSLDSSITVDPSTNLYGAVEQSVTVLENHLSQIDDDVATVGAIALFTDGTDQASRATEADALQKVQNADSKISMYSIGLRGEIDEGFLRSVGKDGSVFASDIDDVGQSFLEIAGFIGDQANSIYELDYCSPRRSGTSHTLELVVRVGNRTGSTTTTYSAEGFSAGCTAN